MVLSAAPGVADLSPALVELTDYVFRCRGDNDDVHVVRGGMRLVQTVVLQSLHSSQWTNTAAVMRYIEVLKRVPKVCITSARSSRQL